MVRFDDAHRAVHYPADRRFRIWIRPSILIGIGIAILSVIVAACIRGARQGDVFPKRSILPSIPSAPTRAFRTFCAASARWVQA